MPYVWDMPTGKKTLELHVAQPRMAAEVSLDEVGDAVPMRAVEKAGASASASAALAAVGPDPAEASGPLPTCLWLQVTLHDKTRTLRISQAQPELTQASDEPQLTLTARLKGIGLSVVRSGVREIAYACLSDIVPFTSAAMELTSISNAGTFCKL